MQQLFWSAGDPDVQPELSIYGVVAEEAIKNISLRYPSVAVDKYMIMPNHIHMIILILSKINGNGQTASAPSLSTIIQQLKRFVSIRTGFSVWQKSFYDTVIRNEKGYCGAWQYIDQNPVKWESDEYYA